MDTLICDVRFRQLASPGLRLTLHPGRRAQAGNPAGGGRVRVGVSEGAQAPPPPNRAGRHVLLRADLGVLAPPFWAWG